MQRLSALDPEHAVILGELEESRQYPMLRFHVASVVFHAQYASLGHTMHVSKPALVVALAR